MTLSKADAFQAIINSYDDTNKALRVHIPTTQTRVRQYVMTATTTNGTPVEMFVDGVSGQRLTMTNYKAWRFKIEGIACNINGSFASPQISGGFMQGVIARYDNASQTVLVSSELVGSKQRFDGLNWGLNLTANTITGGLKIEAVGESGKIINWTISVDIQEASISS